MKYSRFFPKITFQYLSLLIIIFFVYTFAGKLGLSLAYFNASVTAIWPPTGIAIAVFLLLGYRMWPAIFLGAFIVNLTTQGGIATSLGIALGNTLEGVIAAYLVTRFANGKNAFDRTIDVSKFSGLVILATAVSATIGVTTLLLGGYAQLQNYWTIWFTWWFGDIGGALLVAPVIIAYSIHKIRVSFGFDIAKIVQTLLFFLLIILIAQSIFSGSFPFEYFVYPILIWGAFRFGRRKETIAVFLIALIAVWNTIHGLGPFALPHDINRSLLRIAFFLSVTSYSMMAISAALLERKQTRAALSTTEHRFQALIEKSFDAVVLIDPTSKISYATPSSLNVLGYSQKELQGMTGFDLVLPEDRKLTMGALAKLALKPGSTVTLQYRTMRKDGKIIWVEATGTNLLFDPSVSAIVVNFHDITERKIAEEKIRREKEEDAAMLASIGEGIIATDETGKIALVNDAAAQMLKMTRKELVGSNFIDAVVMYDRDNKIIAQAQRPMTKVLMYGKPVITSPDNSYERSDKTKFPVQFTLTPILLKKKVVGTVEVFRDITQEAAIDKAKSEFVSLASHQLRTPLATINWYLERLVNEELGHLKPDQHRYLEEVYHASKRMVDLINTLLNVSRLDLGSFVVEPEKISLPNTLQIILEELRPKIQVKHLVVTKTIDAKLPHIMADAKLLQIIMQNLVTNAIEYSKPDGKVHITISSDTKEYILKVSDNGIGIPKKDQEKIFTKMFRSDNAKIHEAGGNGLGLYLVKTVVEKTGGKIWFESEEDKGTTFYVSFPLSGMKKRAGDKQLR